jgi:putative SOS response-associated peptidase YedK
MLGRIWVAIAFSPAMLASVMCNLYRMTSNAQAIAQLFRADVAGRNLPALEEIYPDQDAPVVISEGAGRSLAMMRMAKPHQKTRTIFRNRTPARGDIRSIA